MNRKKSKLAAVTDNLASVPAFIAELIQARRERERKVDILISQYRRLRIKKPPATCLTALTDWVPSAAIRKRQKKLIADELAEICEFEAQGRTNLACWRKLWLWVHWLRYLVAGPFAWVMKVIGKANAG